MEHPVGQRELSDVVQQPGGVCEFLVRRRRSPTGSGHSRA